MEIAGGTELQWNLRLGQLLHQSGILQAADAVADAAGTEGQGGADALRSGCLTGMDGIGKTQCCRPGKEGLVVLGGEEGLGTRQIRGADTLAEIGLGELQRFEIGLLVRFLGTAHRAEDKGSLETADIIRRGQEARTTPEGSLQCLLLAQSAAGQKRGGEAGLCGGETLVGQCLQKGIDRVFDGLLGLDEREGVVENRQIFV